MRIQVLIENGDIERQCGALHKEHGLSLLFHRDGRQYLLDTGDTGYFSQNAEAMGLDLALLDSVIISHNHHDHIGGLEELFRVNPHVQVWLRAEAKGEFYAEDVEGEYRYIGEQKGLFQRYAGRFLWLEEDYELAPDLWLMGLPFQDPDFVCQDHSLREKLGDQYRQDRFLHELFIVAREEQGLCILSSCSHSGIVNIARAARWRFPEDPIQCIVGGFHMQRVSEPESLNCSPEFVDRTAQELDRLAAESGNPALQVYTGHCTGVAAYRRLRLTFGDRLHSLAPGLDFEV